ncbi:MAG: glycosyltransferase family 4 protein [Thalassobaculales bacterium]
MRRARLMFVVSEDWYFWSHRLPVARAARDAGYEVAVACRVAAHGERIAGEGFRLLPIPFSRRNLNPFVQIRAIFALYRLFRRQKPDLVHLVAVKPIAYGALAARLAGQRNLIAAFAGLGFLFQPGGPAKTLLRLGVQGLLRLGLGGADRWVIVQNNDDGRTLIDAGIGHAGRLVMIPGSGIDPAAYAPAPEAEGRPIAAVVARMLRAKGIEDFVAAARLLKAEGVEASFALIGAPDPESPDAISDAQLHAWHEEGVVEWWGRRDDIAAIWARCAIAVLPSRGGEGVPRSLLEAAACGRPLLASEVAGCRDLVRDGENGLLVPPGDVPALAAALRRLIADRALRQRLGSAARQMVEGPYSAAAVATATLDLYARALSSSDTSRGAATARQ